MRPKFKIYTPKRDDEHPHHFHMRSPPPTPTLQGTKFSLLNALKEVPNGSYIIFNIGEINCREGLLRAVHNCKYDTIEEAISATVEIYIGFLQEQTEQCSFVTFVHPIFPVLDETYQYQIYIFIFFHVQP